MTGVQVVAIPAEQIKPGDLVIRDGAFRLVMHAVAYDSSLVPGRVAMVEGPILWPAVPSHGDDMPWRYVADDVVLVVRTVA